MKKVIVLVDRQEGGRENILKFLAECGFPAELEAVVLRDDVMQLKR